MKLKQLSRHANENCPKKDADNTKVKYKDVVLQAQVLDGGVADTAPENLKRIVLPTMQNDEIGILAKKDPLIVALSNHRITKRNKLRHRNYTSHRMRLAARVVLQMRGKTEEESLTMLQCITHTNFDLLVEAALNVAVRSEPNELEHPSVSILAGYDIRRMANIKLAWGIKKDHQEWALEAEKFLTVRQLEWSDHITNLCRSLLEERKFNKGVDLPTPQDIEKFTLYCKKLLADFDTTDTTLSNMRHASEITETRLMTFNKRRPVEVQAMQVNDWEKRVEGKTLDPNSINMDTMSEWDKHFLKQHEVVTVCGKGGRGVPIIIPSHCFDLLDFLANMTLRESHHMGENPYMFPNQAGKAVDACVSLRRIADSAGLEHPERVKATLLRKYAATYMQLTELRDHEKEWITTHFGHSYYIHVEFYRSTMPILEMTKIARILSLIDKTTVLNLAGKRLKDLELDDIPLEDDPVKLQNDENAGTKTEEQVPVELLQEMEDIVPGTSVESTSSSDGTETFSWKLHKPLLLLLWV